MPKTSKAYCEARKTDGLLSNPLSPEVSLRSNFYVRTNHTPNLAPFSYHLIWHRDVNEPPERTTDLTAFQVEEPSATDEG
jgi:hypothetical protein